MKKYLICYTIAIRTGGFMSGEAYWNLPALTQAELKKANKEITALTKEKDPKTAYADNATITGIFPLDDKAAAEVPSTDTEILDWWIAEGCPEIKSHLPNDDDKDRRTVYWISGHTASARTPRELLAKLVNIV